MRPDTELKGSLRLIRHGTSLSCLSPVRSIVLPHVYGHSRSSAVSSASAEHGASSGAWEGDPSEESPEACTSPP